MDKNANEIAKKSKVSFFVCRGDDKKNERSNFLTQGCSMFVVGNIELNDAKGFHRVVARMPKFAQEYGLWIISGGIDNRTEVGNFPKRNLRKYDFYSISQMYDGYGKLELNGVVRDVKPGNLVLICPGDIHRYGGSNNASYIEDSIRFCGPIADALHKNGILRSGLYHGKPVRIIKPLVELSRDPALSSKLRAALRLQELLADLFDSDEIHKTPVEELLETIRNAPPSYWWNITELAKLSGVSGNTLRKEFLRVTGLLPKAYIENLKLQQAAEMLLYMNWTVRKIAAYFGYRDYYHFSRRFKFMFGLSPVNYRAAMQNSESEIYREQ